MISEDVVVSAMAVLHPAARNLVEFERLLRTGKPDFSLLEVDEEAETVAATLANFTLADWLMEFPHLFKESPLLRQTVGRAPLPTWTASCVGLAAVCAAELTGAERSELAILVAGNNLWFLRMN